MNKANDIDLEKINSMPRNIRVDIATKMEQRINTEVGEYSLLKNSEYQKVAKEIGEEYGISGNEVACLYFGWEAHKKLNNTK